MTAALAVIVPSITAVGPSSKLSAQMILPVTLPSMMQPVVVTLPVM